MAGNKWFTAEDAKASFNLFCCVYGIGTLGMPGNYARAGPVFATIALVFMAAANVYASVVCSKVMLVAPKHVRTFGDMGEWAMGKFGRWLVVIAQMGVCLLVPCAFLVLGAIILDVLFPETFSAAVWMILMAVTILPVCLTPTLKEGAAAAFAGCLGTLLADFIALGVLGYYLAPPVTTPPHPDITLEGVLSTFGNLSLAYGAGIVIPALQRQHTEPKRMPRVIFFTVTLISILFMVIAVTGYAIVGCQIPGNLLFAIAGPKLGFSASKGSIFLAYVSMQVHIVIAFAVILHPALYIGERLFLGMHKTVAAEGLAEEAKSYSNVYTPNTGESADAAGVEQHKRHSQTSVVSMADIDRTEEQEYVDLQAYKAPGARLKSIIFRTVVVALLVALSIVLKDHFLEFVDFVGASATSTSCIILPIIFYLKVFWPSIPIYEKVVGMLFVVVCSALAVYVSYKSAEALFTTPADGGPAFPYCPEEYQTYVYNNATHYDF